MDHPPPHEPHRDGRAFISALVLYAAFYTTFFLQSLLSARYIAPGDAFDFGLADYLATPSLWTPDMYSGYPIAADPQSLTWYPLLQIFRVFHLGWDTFMVAPYVIASAACFLLVRRLTRSTAAATFSGLAYGFSGAFVGNMSHFNQIHAAAWAPLVLYGLQLVREGSGRSGAAVSSAAFAMMWLAGHPQVVVYTFYLAAALVGGGVLVDRPARAQLLNRLSWSALGVALGAGLAAIQILPMAELGSISGRAGPSWDLYIYKALPAWQILTMTFPAAFGFWAAEGASVEYFGDGSPGENLGYIGLVALALALAAPLLRSRHRAEARVWISLAVAALLLAVGPATPLGTLFFYAPGYARFRVPSRHLFLMTLCLAVGAGFALAELMRRRAGSRAVAGTTVATMLAAGVAFALFAWRTPAAAALVHNPTYLTWALGWPLLVAGVVVAGALLLGRGNREAPASALGLLLLCLQAIDMAVVHYRVPGYANSYDSVTLQETTPHPRMVTLAAELQRTGGRVLAADGSHNPFLLPNLTRPWGIPAAGGNGPLAIREYAELLELDPPGDVAPRALSESHRGPDLFAVQYVLVPEDSPMARDLVEQKGRWSALESLHYDEADRASYYTLFRNTRARPRAWCVGSVARASARQSLTAVQTGRFADGRTFEPATTALVRPGVLDDWPADRAGEGFGEVTAREGPAPRYYVDARQSCLLVVSEPYYPWWRATIDAAPAPIERVDHALIGIVVPPGPHVVDLRLRPVSVWIGGAISAACALCWVAIAGTRRGTQPRD